MNILGIYNGHNASACLLRDGAIVCAISEEKFNNKKNWTGFPEQSIEWCAAFAEEHGERIDAVAIAGETPWLPDTNVMSRAPGFKRMLKNSVLPALRAPFLQRVVNLLHQKSYQITAASVREQIAARLSSWVGADAIHYLDHHSCHAAAGYFGLLADRSKDALVFTLDGYGDFVCATVSIGRDGKLERIASTPMEHSIGGMYGRTTAFLGMKENEHEYKVMGLAPYSRDYYKDTYERLFRGIVYRKAGTLEFSSKFDTQYFHKYLRENAVGERFDNIAAALQACTEDLITDWVRAAIAQTGIRTVITSGGVFMNVKANMKIAEMPEVEAAYFMPSCGDETTPVGAAYLLHQRLTGAAPHPFDNIYWGMSFSNDDVRSYIERNVLDSKYDIAWQDDVEAKTAELLSQHQVVARVKGRCEFGARALGNRSILANPSDMESFYTVNDQIKCRDFWMPFAPSILYEEQDRYVVNPKKLEAPYMILGFQSTELAHKHLRAAMHQGDKTVRAQLVRREVNAQYHGLISAFRGLTGIGGVMNTSLNLHGLPLVGTLEQALFTFENSGLRHMTLENWLVSKR